MFTVSVPAVSYLLGAAAFAVLTVLLLTSWRGRLQGGLLVLACALTIVWCVGAAGFGAFRTPPFSAVLLLEVLRDGAWFAFLLKLLGFTRRSGDARRGRLRSTAIVAFVLCAALLVIGIANRYVGDLLSPTLLPERVIVFGHVLMSVLGLVLVEQFYRNTRLEHRWSIKFLCFGVGGVFAYDFYLFADALLFNSVNWTLWSARGAIQATIVPLIAVSAARNPNWSVDIFVSRHIVFHSAAFMGAGAYLMMMAGAGYYIRLYGGSWGGIAQIIFLFGAVLLLVLLMVSGQVRSRVKVFFSKHFFRNRYDYREEWLAFTHTLSIGEPGLDFKSNVIRAIAAIVESPGGVLFTRTGAGRFEVEAQWNGSAPAGASTGAEESMARFLGDRGWVIFLDEYRRYPESYEGLELPEWLEESTRAWLVVPLMHGDELIAFIVFTRSGTKANLNWEDTDLLKTVGRQAGGHLALVLATEALAEARQFEAFNRLSAYVVHDLKNMVAQLSLVVSNARRHMHSPGFMEDAIGTVDNAAQKMNRLLAQLRAGRVEALDVRDVDLNAVLASVTRSRAVTRPAPTLQLPDEVLRVSAEPVRLASVVEHLVQNAQEATALEGAVSVSLQAEGPWAVVEVSDNGCGMDAGFVSHRLFRPFDTTKGNAGMGVGVYETREFVHAQGGSIEVDSEPGRGTTFRMRFPLAPRIADGDRPASVESGT